MNGWEAKMALLEPLVVEDEAAAVPRQEFHAISTLRHEDEEMTGEEILLPAVAHQRGQAADAVPHVDRLGSEENPNRPR